MAWLYGMPWPYTGRTARICRAERLPYGLGVRDSQFLILQPQRCPWNGVAGLHRHRRFVRSVRDRIKNRERLHLTRWLRRAQIGGRGHGRVVLLELQRQRVAAVGVVIRVI